MKYMTGFLLFVLVMLGSGCHSTQVNWRSYQVVPMAEGKPDCCAKLEVTKVILPEMVNRLELVREVSPCQVEISHYGKWCGRLHQMMEEVLNENLRRLAPLPRKETAEGGSTRRVSLQFITFCLTEKGEFQVEAICREKGRNPRRISLKRQYEMKGDADVMQAEATSKILKEIAEVLLTCLTDQKKGI